MRRLQRILRRNRVGAVVACVHAVGIVWIILSRVPETPPFEMFAGETTMAGRVFHLSYEPAFTQFAMIVDLPALLVFGVLMSPLGLCLWLLGFGQLPASYLAAMAWVLGGSLQWWLAIGWMQSLVRKTG